MQGDGPIPGENFTSDTKNYAWHRPPEYDDLDTAIEASAKQLMSKQGQVGLLTLMKQGTDVATLTDMFVTSGIGAGKWTPDFAILLSGPISAMIFMMGAQYGLKPVLGIDNDFHGPTSAWTKAISENPVEKLLGPPDEEMTEPVDNLQEDAQEAPAAPQLPATGFMG